MPRIWRAVALLGGVPMLAGCLHGPLSTLDPASAVTRSVATLWWVMAAGTGFILIAMLALGVWAVLRSRHVEASAPRSAPWLLIGGGLVLPGAVIAALLAYGLRLDEVQWPPGARAEAQQAFHVDLVAHRWWWEARYPGAAGGGKHGAGVASESRGMLRTVNAVYVPAGVPVHLRIFSTDVIHGFWVPRIAGKLDAVPGRINRIRLLVEAPGEYAGICAEYCGEGHAHMQFTLIALAPAELSRRLAEASEGVE